MNPEPQPARLSLDDCQRAMLHRVACELITAAAKGRPTSLDETDLGGLAQEMVVGVFVTLRKDGQLRGCIGNFTASLPLAKALERAATGVVTRDPRFTPLLPSELPDLTVEVSLLHSRELLGSTAEERVANLVIGQHGLDIEHRGRTGLLLPQVAVDLQCDAVAFLGEVCRKAGLPRDAWHDVEAVIYRFGAIRFGGTYQNP